MSSAFMPNFGQYCKLTYFGYSSTLTGSQSIDQVYVAFDLLAGLSPTVANSVGEQVMAGLILVFQKHKDIIRYSFLL